MFGKTRKLYIKTLYTSLTDPQNPVHVTEWYMHLCKALSLAGFMKIKLLWAVAQLQRSSYLEKKEFLFCFRTSFVFTNYLTVHVPSLFLNNFTAIMCSFFPDFAVSFFNHGNLKWTYQFLTGTPVLKTWLYELQDSISKYIYFISRSLAKSPCPTGHTLIWMIWFRTLFSMSIVSLVVLKTANCSGDILTEFWFIKFSNLGSVANSSHLNSHE